MYLLRDLQMDSLGLYSGIISWFGGLSIDIDARFLEWIGPWGCTVFVAMMISIAFVLIRGFSCYAMEIYY